MLDKPILTEKSFLHASKGVYTFAVLRSSTKTEVKAAVESLFKVHVEKLTSTVRKHRAARTGRRRLLTPVAPTKLVRVWLKKGQSIPLFDIKKD